MKASYLLSINSLYFNSKNYSNQLTITQDVGKKKKKQKRKRNKILKTYLERRRRRKSPLLRKRKKLKKKSLNQQNLKRKMKINLPKMKIILKKTK